MEKLGKLPGQISDVETNDLIQAIILYGLVNDELTAEMEAKAGGGSGGGVTMSPLEGVY